MRLKSLSPDETAAIQWWSAFITEAEIVTSNPLAVRNPQIYAHDLAIAVWRKEETLLAIVDMWKQAADEGRLFEPLWPKTQRHPIRNVLVLAA